MSLRENVDNDRRLVWMDLETTGLDPLTGVVLEIGVVITTLDLEEIARKSWVIPHDREQILDKMDDYVLKMHLGSDLLEEVWGGVNQGFRATQKNRDNIEGAIRAFIFHNTGYNSTADNFLCGSTVGSFDMQWLKRHAPTILEAVSYRVGDVSAFKVFFQDLLETSGESAHRALPDLDHSIDLLRQMRDSLSMVSSGRSMIESAAAMRADAEAAQQTILDEAAGL